MAKSRKTQSALLLAGAAAGVGVAAAWFGRRRLTLVRGGNSQRDTASPRPELASAPSPRDIERPPFVDAESAELPIGRSADPDIESSLSRKYLPQDDTTGTALFGDEEPESSPAEVALDAGIWDALPELAEPGRGDGYDAVSPDELGSVWLERATETTHEPILAPAADHVPIELEGSLVSEASITNSHVADGGDTDIALEAEREAEEEDEDEDEEIAEDALDLDEPDWRPHRS
jgi:hypothetical protein